MWDEEDKDTQRAGLQPTHALFGEEGGRCHCGGETHSQSEPLHMTCCLHSFPYGEDGEKIWSLPEPFGSPWKKPKQTKKSNSLLAGEKRAVVPYA